VCASGHIDSERYIEGTPLARRLSVNFPILKCADFYREFPRGYPEKDLPVEIELDWQVVFFRVTHLVEGHASQARTRFRAARLDVQDGAWYTEPNVPMWRWRCENNGSCRIQT
jgi:hypothetical protein